MADGKNKVGLYVDVPPWVKYELERLALERRRDGESVNLRTVVIEALTEYLQRRGVEPPAAQ